MTGARLPVWLRRDALLMAAACPTRDLLLTEQGPFYAIRPEWNQGPLAGDPRPLSRLRSPRLVPGLAGRWRCSLSAAGVRRTAHHLPRWFGRLAAPPRRLLVPCPRGSPSARYSQSERR